MLLALAPFAGSAADVEMAPLWSQPMVTVVGSSPAIDAGGSLYITTSGYTNFKDFSGGKLVALTSVGKPKWEFKTFCDIKSSPALDGDGNVYFGGRDRKFYAVDPQGKLKWAFATSDWVDSSAAIATNGTVYFGGWDKKFYALNPDGSKKWVFETGGPIDSSPAIAADGTIYFGSHDKKFYALNPDGTQQWAFTTGGAIISSPALNCDGTIYFTSVDGNLYLLNRDGTQKMRLKTGGSGPSSPVIDTAGNIYLCATNQLQCLAPDGKRKWDFGYPRMDGAAAIAADGVAYFAIIGDFGVGAVLGFDPAGNLVKGAHPSGGITGSPAIGSGGAVYIGSSIGFFALSGTAGPAKGCWSKFRGNAAQNGRVNGDGDSAAPGH